MPRKSLSIEEQIASVEGLAGHQDAARYARLGLAMTEAFEKHGPQGSRRRWPEKKTPRARKAKPDANGQAAKA